MSPLLQGGFIDDIELLDAPALASPRDPQSAIMNTVTDAHNGPSPKARTLGLQALRRQRFEQAIEHLSVHLERHPDDVEASMELGLAELLSGERMRFARRYASLCALFSTTAPPTPRGRMLWERCRRVGESMAAAALLLTAAGIPATAAGCARPAPSEQIPSVTVAAPVEMPPVPLDAPAPEATTAAPAPDASATPAATPVRPPPPDFPRTRYVAVRPHPVPDLAP